MIVREKPCGVPLAKDRQGWRSLTAAFTSELVVIYLRVPRCSALDGCGEQGDDAKQAVRAERSTLPNHEAAAAAAAAAL